jgi:ATP-binding cassette subfamily F protein 3
VEFRAGAIRVFLGGIEDYLVRHQAQTLNDPFKGTSKASAASVVDQRAVDGLSDKERKRREAELRNRRYSATKDLRKKIGDVEKKIATLEEQKEKLHELLAQPETYGNAEKARAEQKRLSDVEQQLGDCYFSWERLSSELESIESAIE